MVSYVEDAFRTYGEDAVLKILGCTVNGARSGTAFGCSSGTAEAHIAGSSFENCPRKGIHASNNTTIRNTAADFKYSPAVNIGAWCIGSSQNVDASVTLLPSATDDSITKQFYSFSKLPEANQWPFVAAQIAGTGHEVELKAGADDLGKPDAPILMGKSKWTSDMGAKDITLVNRTDQPVILRSNSRNCTVTSKGPVDDRGSNNDVQSL
jgi:hypothetical protein